MQEHKNISIANQVFEQLEHDILIGKYRRGELLTELKLSETLGVSRTPVREAIRRLEQEHIIEETSRGAVVVGISRADIMDMYEIRICLEGRVAELAAQNISEENLQKMHEILELQKYYAEKQGLDCSENIKELDSQFHKLLYLSSKSMAYCDTLLPIHKKLIKYRKVSVSNTSRALQSQKEHEQILEAIEKHDGRLAKELTVKHLVNARDNILNKEID